MIIFTISAGKENAAQDIGSQLIKTAQGDMEAFSSLYENTKTAVYAFLLSYLSPHDAEDAMQDTYVALFKSAGSYKPGSPMAWIFGIAKNTALMKLRKSRLDTTLTEEEWSRIEEGSDELTPEDKHVLRQLLTGLAKEEQRIILLHISAGMKFREISELLCLPLPTVLSKYSRALKKMKKALKEESEHGQQNA